MRRSKNDDVQDMSEMSFDEKEDAKNILRTHGLTLAPGVEKKMREIGISIEEVEALMMRALDGES
jgi:hypothetical protein